MSLQRKVTLYTMNEPCPVNVYDSRTKKIVFTGSQKDASVFLGVKPNYVNTCLIKKWKVKRIYAIRNKSEKAN